MRHPPSMPSLPNVRQRENYEVQDIEGAQVGWRPRNERARADAAPLNQHFDVRDINAFGFKSQRMVDPQRPEYRVNGMLIRDDLKYTTPKPLPAPAAHPYFTLKTDDIPGAQSGWIPPHACQPPMDMRRHFRNTNFVGDIEGAQADTVRPPPFPLPINCPQQLYAFREVLRFFINTNAQLPPSFLAIF
jgi:hypothetical protein